MPTHRLGIAELLAMLILSIGLGARAETAPPGRTSNANQPFGFRVKGSENTTVKGLPNLTPVLNLLPQKNGRATLAGLTAITVTFDNSFTYTANVDSKGKVSGAFTARLLSGGQLLVLIKNFDVTGILMVNTSTDGIFQTPPIAITLTVTQGVTPVVLLSIPDLIVTYKVNHGVATAKAVKQ